MLVNTAKKAGRIILFAFYLFAMLKNLSPLQSIAFRYKGEKMLAFEERNFYLRNNYIPFLSITFNISLQVLSWIIPAAPHNPQYQYYFHIYQSYYLFTCTYIFCLYPCCTKTPLYLIFFFDTHPVFSATKNNHIYFHPSSFQLNPTILLAIPCAEITKDWKL